MKVFKMLIIAALTIITISANAQDKNGKKDPLNKTTVYSCPMHADITSTKPGKCSKCGMELTALTKKKKDAIAFFCPMKCEGDKTYDSPGKCPICGMNLKEKKEKDHSDHKH